MKCGVFRADLNAELNQKDLHKSQGTQCQIFKCQPHLFIIESLIPLHSNIDFRKKNQLTTVSIKN